MIMSSENNDSFTSSFAIYMTFVSFSYLPLHWLVTSSTMLNRSREAVIFALFSILGSINLYDINRFVTIAIYQIREIFFYSYYAKSFYHERRLNFSSDFFLHIEMMFFLFYSVDIMNYPDCALKLEPTLHSQDEPDFLSICHPFYLLLNFTW